MTTGTIRRHRSWLLWMAAARAGLALAAIPLAPLLYRDHFLVLVLLRPTKEVLLAGGFLARRGDMNLLALLAAATPLAILGVWHFYYLGRGYAREIQSGGAVPSFAGRILPTERIRKLCKLLERDGTRVVVLGRLASFPSTLLGAAAGASGLPSRRFLPADLAGATASIAEVVGAGYVLGRAYNQVGPWVTGLGVAVMAGLVVGAGRALVRA